MAEAILKDKNSLHSLFGRRRWIPKYVSRSSDYYRRKRDCEILEPQLAEEEKAPLNKSEESVRGEMKILE
jgi:hypothetical protein